MCPLSKRPLSNVHPAAVLRPSGMVVSTQCVKDCIKKDMLDPFTEPPVRAPHLAPPPHLTISIPTSHRLHCLPLPLMPPFEMLGAIADQAA